LLRNTHAQFPAAPTPGEVHPTSTDATAVTIACGCVESAPGSARSRELERSSSSFPTDRSVSRVREHGDGVGASMGNVVGRRYRYGASFVERLSGVRFEGHHPMLRPDLWKLYLNEAEGIYRDHGFEGTLRRRELEEGNGVSLFFLGFAPDGKVVAGVRCHGPLDGSHQTALLEEMHASPEIDDVARVIDRHVAHGALEIKGAFSKGERETGYRLVATISRTVTHAMQWLGAEYAVAAVSDFLLATGHETGARQIGTQSVPFPDERYRTVAVEWIRARSHELCSPAHQLDLRLEAEQLSRRQPVNGKGPVDPLSTSGAAWRPVVLDVAKRAHREVLQVLREDTSLQVLDRYLDQRAELEALRPPPSQALLEDGQRWVYYPWRRTVVRLLAPRAFAALRLDRNRNKLTREEQAQQRSLRIGVIGLSAGHSIAHVLAMEGLAGELRLADFDTLELSNLNRLPGTVLDLGLNKAIIAARRIAEIDPYVRVVVEPAGIRQDNLDEFLEGLDLVLEECDSLDVKLLVREFARDRRIPVVMETSDRGVLDVERFDLEPERPIFHGLLPGVHSSDLEGLSLEAKAPFVLRMMGASDVSSRGAASLLEVGRTITAWPQLGSEVTLGAATAAAVVRRFGLRGHLPSGRVRIDIDESVDGLAPVELAEPMPDVPDAPSALPEDADDIDRIVDAARRAPSGGNVQPWRFEADDGEIRFYLVPERTTAMDVRFRASYVAIGASLFNARVAAAAERRLGPIKLFPEGYPSRHVATLRLGDASDFEVAPLHSRLQTRAANRRLGQPAPIEPSTVQLLARGVEREGAQLRLVTERDRLERCGELLAESDRIRFLTPTLHREMMAELRVPGRDTVDEGIDVRTLELGPAELASLDLLRRPDVMAHLAEWRAGTALGMRSRVSVATSSAMAAIVVPRADPIAYVRGGAAVERFWLTAEVHGLAVHPISPVFLFAVDAEERLGLVGERNLDALTELANRFGDLFGLGDGERVALLLRVSHAAPPSVASARLPLTHLLSRQREESPAMAVVQPWQNGASAGLGELRN
jgi:molybdopterin/thiamine biosynthesis adenylyltransferase/nitroreductase